MKVFEKIENYFYGPYYDTYPEKDLELIHEDLRRIVRDLADIRDNKKETEDYFKDKIKKYESEYLGKSSDLINALINVLEEDKLSFSYIYFYLTDWIQGIRNLPPYHCPIQKEIEYAIFFDLDEIEERVKHADDPVAVIMEYLGKSNSYISLNSTYKKMVEERLQQLLNSYNVPIKDAAVPDFCEFLVRQENAGEDMKKLHALFDGKKGKDLAIAVCAAAYCHIISKSPSFKKLKEHFDVHGSHSAYEQYQNQYLDYHKINTRERTTFDAYVEKLRD